MIDGDEWPSLRDLFVGALRSPNSGRGWLLLFLAPVGLIAVVGSVVERRWLLAGLGLVLVALVVLGALGLQWRHVANGEEALDRARRQESKVWRAALTWRGRLLYYAFLVVILGLFVLWRVLVSEWLR